jgi:predicted AAA+ superfamily ATPase
MRSSTTANSSKLEIKSRSKRFREIGLDDQPKSAKRRIIETSSESANKTATKESTTRSNETSEVEKSLEADNMQNAISIVKKAIPYFSLGVPVNIAGREVEKKTISEFLENCVEVKKSGRLYISGSPGTGKTALVHEILEMNTKITDIILLEINCMEFATHPKVLQIIASISF